MVTPVRAASMLRLLPVVTCLLIALNTAVFLVGPASGLDPLYGSGAHRAAAEQAYFLHWGVVPQELLDNRAGPGEFPGVPALSVLTAMFVHAGWPHLLGNMVFLYVFGAMVEERLGRLPFLLFYVAVGYLATYGYALVELRGASGGQALVGASGAIAGVLGAFLRLYPRARVTSVVPTLLFLPLRFPAWVVLGLWFVIQGVSVRDTSAAAPDVAYAAHLIGFAGGFLFAWLLYCRGRGRGYAGPSVRPPSQETSQ
ncbi:rhomboid family intramembrane serine protease [Streptacidiphilus sp. 4-A2]|nr:rhomboid family intramembrane serine protease [Streptacidiphilus sp. 4-A2]